MQTEHSAGLQMPRPGHLSMSQCPGGAVHAPCWGPRGGLGHSRPPRSTFLLVLGKLKAKEGRKPTGKVPRDDPCPPVKRPIGGH